MPEAALTEFGYFHMCAGFGDVNLSAIVNPNQIYFTYFEVDNTRITNYIF